MKIDTVKEIISTLNPESDRGVVLVIGAQMEACLEAHILARLVSPADDKELFIGRSLSCIVQTFGAKIRLAQRVGIITKDEERVYDQLRKLRNDCAHEIDSNEFGDERFIQRIRNIIAASEPLWLAMSRTVKGTDGQPKYESVDQYIVDVGWRNAFVLFFSMIIAHKKDNVHRITRIKSSNEVGS